jgi:DNA-binding transcriptional MocR family regulator
MALNLARLKGQQPEKFSGNNEETFELFDAKKWNDTVRQLDEVMNELEKFVETAGEPQLKDAAQTLARISMHNAYHIGQIIYVRKEQGS